MFGFNFNSRELQEIIKKNPLIIDVRTPEEFSSGHIENSENIPLSEIPKKISDIRDKKRPVITVCLSGGRSGSAAKILQQNGIEAVNGGPWNGLKLD